MSDEAAAPSANSAPTEIATAPVDTRVALVFFFVAMFALAITSLGHGLHSAGYDWKLGDQIEVEWRGQWYPATVEGRLWLWQRVHYHEFGNDWDEWVSTKRTRLLREPPLP